jgi:hypothetical protein
MSEEGVNAAGRTGLNDRSRSTFHDSGKGRYGRDSRSRITAQEQYCNLLRTGAQTSLLPIRSRVEGGVCNKTRRMATQAGKNIR